MSISAAAYSTVERRVTPDKAPPLRLEEIRSKALALFAERGFAQVGMRELALHLGMGTGSLYNYFESKENLLFEFIEELYQALFKALLRTEKHAAPDRLEALVKAHIALHKRWGLHFLLAEREFCCLCGEHQQHILQMRSCYEAQMLTLSIEAGAVGAPAVLRGTIHSVVSWLNNLPDWQQMGGLIPAQQQEVFNSIALGALSAVLKSPAE
ncbi:transcriptional repressor BetI [Pseudomonas sp. 25 R 14]|nr:transcriptional repressor BetI [Pseudomonas sp. 25 R 14]